MAEDSKLAFEEILDHRIQDVREVVTYSDEQLPDAKCYVLLGERNWLEIYCQDPRAHRPELISRSPEGWWSQSISSPIASSAKNKIIVDLLRCESLASVGLLLEGKEVLYLHACAESGLRAQVDPLDSQWLEGDEYYSWVTQERIA